MKNFRRLISKSIWSLIGVVTFIFALLVLVFFCVKYDSVEHLVGTLILFLIFWGLFLLVFLIYGIIIWLSYLKAKDNMKNIPGFSIDRFEREVTRSPKLKNMLICSDAICFYNSFYMVRTIPLKDIVWAYQEQSQNLVGLKICTRDGECYSVPVMIKRKVGKKDMAERYLLRLIARKNKGVMIGYSEIQEKMFQNALSQFLQEMPQIEVVDSALLEQEYIQNDYYIKDFH